MEDTIKVKTVSVKNLFNEVVSMTFISVHFGHQTKRWKALKMKYDLYNFLLNKWYVDEIYDFLTRKSY